MAYTKHKRIVALQQEKPFIAPADTQSYYSRPQHAADIWIEGDFFILGFPPSAEHVRGHTVKIPVNELGVAALRDCLRARAQSKTHCVIGTKGAITGYQLEQILRHMQPVKYDEKGQRKTTLEDLGLD